MPLSLPQQIEAARRDAIAAWHTLEITYTNSGHDRNACDKLPAVRDRYLDAARRLNTLRETFDGFPPLPPTP